MAPPRDPNAITAKAAAARRRGYAADVNQFPVAVRLLGFDICAICLSMNAGAIRLIAFSTLLRPGRISSLPASIPAMARLTANGVTGELMKPALKKPRGPAAQVW